MPVTLHERIRRAWKDRPRRRQMIVTDITRMAGDRVCVGGYLEDGTAVRPIAAKSGPTEAWLRSAQGAPVTQFALVELRVSGPPQPLLAPHTEDRAIPADGHRVLRVLSETERRDLLARSASPSVRAIFGAEIHADPQRQWGCYVRSGEGARSLGTIRAGSVRSVHYDHYAERGRWDYRLRFTDSAGEEFQLAVVDLGFRGALDILRDGGRSPDDAAALLLTALQRQTAYLRIGLARGWERHPDRCYLQVTGVYGFS